MNIQRLLNKLVDAILRRPKTVVMAAVLPCLLFASFIPSVPMDLSFSAILPEDEPLVDRYYNFNKSLEAGGRVFYLVDGEEERLDDVMTRFKASMTERDDVRYVALPPSVEELTPLAPWLIEQDRFDDWTKIIEGGMKGDDYKRIRQELADIEQQIDEQESEMAGYRVALLRLGTDPLFEEMGKSSFTDVNDAAMDFFEAEEVSAVPTGIAAISVQDQRRTLSRIVTLSPISLFLALLILMRMEPRLSRLALVALPMMIALPASIGLSGKLTGQITMLESMFGIILFGLGIDFALHLIGRFRTERAKGEDFETALRTTMTQTGPGVIAGGMTTIGSFLIISFAPDPNALHLGLSGFIGLLLCLIMMMTAMPALWVVFHRRKPAISLSPLKMNWVMTTAEWATSKPRRTLFFGLLFIVVALSGSSRFKHEKDLSKIINRETPAISTADDLQAKFGLTHSPWFSIVDNTADLSRVHNALENIDFIGRVDSLSPLHGEGAQERWQNLKSIQPQLKTKREELVGQLGMMGSPFGFVPSSPERIQETRDMIKGIQKLEKAAEEGPPSVDRVPDWFKSQLLGPNGEKIIYAYPTEASMDATEIRRQRLALEKIDPQVASVALMIEGIINASRDWIWYTFFGIVAFVMTLLAVDNRSLKWVGLALIPVLFGCTMTFGIMCWTGVQFSQITMMAIPLLVGLGVDDGIHVVHRMREKNAVSAAKSAGLVGQPIVMTTLTTSSSFGVMMFTDHPGMESLALTLLIGMPLCLLASITLIPAAAIVLGVAKKSPSS